MHPSTVTPDGRHSASSYRLSNTAATSSYGTSCGRTPKAPVATVACLSPSTPYPATALLADDAEHPAEQTALLKEIALVEEGLRSISDAHLPTIPSASTLNKVRFEAPSPSRESPAGGLPRSTTALSSLQLFSRNSPVLPGEEPLRRSALSCVNVSSAFSYTAKATSSAGHHHHHQANATNQSVFVPSPPPIRLKSSLDDCDDIVIRSATSAHSGRRSDPAGGNRGTSSSLHRPETGGGAAGASSHEEHVITDSTLYRIMSAATTARSSSSMRVGDAGDRAGNGRRDELSVKDRPVSSHTIQQEMESYQIDAIKKRYLPMTAKQALHQLQLAIRALVTCRGTLEVGSIPSLLLTTYNIVSKQVFHDRETIVLSDEVNFSRQPQSIFDALAEGGEDTTIVTELRDLNRELSLTKKHYHVAIQQIDIFKHRIHDHVKEIARLEKALDDSNAIEFELRGKVSGLQQALQRQEVENAELKGNLVALHSSLLDNQKTDHARVTERTADLRQELVSLYEQLRQQEEMGKSFERETANLQLDARRIEERYDEQAKELSTTQSLLANREDELYHSKQNNMELEKRVKALDDTIKDLLLVQGDTMIQDKMIRENPKWLMVRECVALTKRSRKSDSQSISGSVKFFKGFGVQEKIPNWLKGEGKIKPKSFTRCDVLHIALQSLTDLSLPASLSTNIRALVAAASAPQQQSGPLLTAPTAQGGRSLSIAGPRRDDPNSPTRSSLGGGSSRKSISGPLGGNTVGDLSNRSSFSDNLKMWLSRTGTDVLNNKQGVELAYAFYHGLVKWKDEPDLILYDAILRGDVPPELHYHVYRALDELYNLFLAADELMHNGDPRRALPITTVARVIKQAVALPSSFASAADSDHLLFLLTLDFNVPYIAYKSIFDLDEDGDRNAFLQEFFSITVRRSLEYYDTLQDMLESLAKEELAKGKPVDMPTVLATTEAIMPPPNAVVADSAATAGAPSNSESQTRRVSNDSSADIHAEDVFEADASDNLPGSNNPSRNIPEHLKTVEVSLARFGDMWLQEDPGREDDISDLLRLIHTTVVGMEQAALAKKKADEDAAAAAAAAAASKGRRGTQAVPPPGPKRHTIAPREEPPQTTASTVERDLYPLASLVAAVRQLVLTRVAHRTAGSMNSSTSVPLLQSTSDNTIKSASRSISPSSLRSGDPLSVPHTARKGDGSPSLSPSSFHLAPNRDVSVSFDPSDAPLAAKKTASFNPAALQPLFDLDKFAEEWHSHHRQRSQSTFRLLNSGDLMDRGGFVGGTGGGSIATQSMAGGGFGVPQSRNALAAFSKRSVTSLPPFFKARMMKH